MKREKIQPKHIDFMQQRKPVIWFTLKMTHFRILIVSKRSMASVCMTKTFKTFFSSFSLSFCSISTMEKCAIKFIIWFLHRDIMLHNESEVQIIFFFFHHILYRYRLNETLWHEVNDNKWQLQNELLRCGCKARPAINKNKYEILVLVIHFTKFELNSIGFFGSISSFWSLDTVYRLRTEVGTWTVNYKNVEQCAKHETVRER